MDAIRRGAMAKIGRVAAGATGLAGSVGRGNVAMAEKGAFEQMNIASPPVSPYPEGINKSLMIEKASPLQEARWKAVEPLRGKIRELEGYDSWRVSDYMQHPQSSPYLSALRSTAPHWRASVLMDRQKAKRSAIDALHEQMNKMLRSPLDALEEGAQQAIAAFMNELQRP